jgi:hypothetical protein
MSEFETPRDSSHATTSMRLGPAARETMTDRARHAAGRAPFWVIAAAAHLVLAAVLGMTTLGSYVVKTSSPPVSAELAPERKETMLEDRPPVEETLERFAIPQVEDVAIDDVMDDVFVTATDDVVNPMAESSMRFGVSEGEPDGPADLLSMSSGGRGLAGAIGLGGGSGPGGGARRGSPLGGSRLARRNAQSGQLRQTEAAVMAGLAWLARHQSEDGSWDCDGFSLHCDPKRGERCSGRGSPVFDLGVTALAVLPFLGAGYDSRRETPYRVVVADALKYLKASQDAEGCFGPRSDSRFTYSHAIATLAMCEAYASSKRIPWRVAAQHGLEFIAACQNPYRAWRYGVRPGDNDVSVTGWMLMAMKAGKDAGLLVSDRAMKDGLAFIETMTDEDTNRTGYVRKGELPVRPEGLEDRWPASESESLTAVAMCSRAFCGVPNEGGIMKGAAELLAKKLPVWDESRGTIDMYYWYYGTLAMHQFGGRGWDEWNRRLKDVVIANQVARGCGEGSWAPLDPWGEEAGRVYSTSLMTLCMEVYYRYPRVFGARTTKGG